MKGTFNQGWWNCFESFAIKLSSINPNADIICTEILREAAITEREARAWLDKPVERNPAVEEIVRYYFLKHLKRN